MDSGTKKLTSQEKKALIEAIQKPMTTYPEFPKPGINFVDVFSIFGDPTAFDALYTLTKATIDEYMEERKESFNVVVALQTRGFLLGTILARDYKVPFVAVRKPNKLPAKVETLDYKLEYGSGTLQVQSHVLNESHRALIVDDLVATGGTLWASGELVKKLGAKIAMYYCSIKVKELSPQKLLDEPEKLVTLFEV